MKRSGLDLPWQKVGGSVKVKLYEHEGELYVLAKSEGRQAKEDAMRRKRLACLLQQAARHAQELAPARSVAVTHRRPPKRKPAGPSGS
jgi:hypothetical protein